MYRYDDYDQTLVNQRIADFRDAVARRLSGHLSEEEFKLIRQMNGVYLQLHAYMLRVAIPYGSLDSRQMHKLAHIARIYDKGYGHFTTRQNIQYNWPSLREMPDLLQELAAVQMHAIQTSGNLIRNVTADQYAGATAEEVDDPRPYAELIRQWSTLHPEFSFLPRKFKIAVTASATDRTAVKFHDIGLILHDDPEQGRGFEVIVGGGMGRTPFVGPSLRDHLPEAQILTYLEAVLRTYNELGRRDNAYKARIKILVHELGAEAFRTLVEDEFAKLLPQADDLPQAELLRIRERFIVPELDALPARDPGFDAAYEKDEDFRQWVKVNSAPHKVAGYIIANISLKPYGGIPGDISADQMDLVADLAERYGHDEIRATHAQNLVLPHVKLRDLYDIWQALSVAGLGTANLDRASDIIACPGLDYCVLANARSIPIAQEISKRFAAKGREDLVGELKIKISGCINACGHHHAGHIGILGVDRKGEEMYQLTLGGSGDEQASIGQITGRGFDEAGIVDAVDTVVETYLGHREDHETFLETYRRLGPAPFKEALYGTA
ncbi:sulfite reductase [Iodidimonas nitroreducens]|uniref:Sulfite reductase n=1 Tax=Iodidimonas nitroreducens TaxID=1236968 RepID=A0A5A7N276_9PROT|nr:nitrite/sulfite reductase [Iodidimonas nitroreducens]GAK34878.1 sulfite reductase [ferredoxin] 1 [alpha proteobacterium Q-1]GER02383.1 sulfite reductase [Iodidimonas nitroreducens]